MTVFAVKGKIVPLEVELMVFDPKYLNFDRYTAFEKHKNFKSSNIHSTKQYTRFTYNKFNII